MYATGNASFLCATENSGICSPLITLPLESAVAWTRSHAYALLKCASIVLFCVNNWKFFSQIVSNLLLCLELVFIPKDK